MRSFILATLALSLFASCTKNNDSDQPTPPVTPQPTPVDTIGSWNVQIIDTTQTLFDIAFASNTTGNKAGSVACKSNIK